MGYPFQDHSRDKPIDMGFIFDHRKNSPVRTHPKWCFTRDNPFTWSCICDDLEPDDRKAGTPLQSDHQSHGLDRKTNGVPYRNTDACQDTIGVAIVGQTVTETAGAPQLRNYCCSYVPNIVNIVETAVVCLHVCIPCTTM